MSHFYGNLHGARGEATRQGHKSTGLTARGAGWDLGATVNMTYNEELKRNELTVSIDKGNNSREQVESFSFAVTREGVKQI